MYIAIFYYLFYYTTATVCSSSNCLQCDAKLLMRQDAVSEFSRKLSSTV